MKKHNNKKRVRVKAGTSRSQVKQKVIDMKPEDLAVYVQRAEKEALSTIKDLEISAGAAILLLAQCTQVLITGDSRLTMESATSITDSVLALWDTGYYQPGPQYPFTLKETLFDLKNDMRVQKDYSECFQVFTPTHANTSVGIGQIAGGIAKHPKTCLWQVWIIADGPCALLGAYHDPIEAQRSLERVINIARYGDAVVKKHVNAATDAWHLYHELISQGDGKPEQFPFAMMAYLIDHLHVYMIDL